ncbi:pyridoxal phosphate-dependent transferase [Terfezia claveryi]|nr:pyridoxal phosphate-dependent transferase [Terfezia claveryi]
MPPPPPPTATATTSSPPTASSRPPPSPTTPIDLLRGHPTTRLLATTPFLSATTTVLGTPSSLPQDSRSQIRHPLTYGPDSGNLDVRREIVAWQEELYGGEELDMTPNGSRRINLTCGASYGLLNALVQCTSPGTGYTRRAFLVSPTYFLACAIFIDAGFTNLLTALPYPPLSASTKTLPDILLSHLQADAPSPSNPHVPLHTGLSPIGGPSPNSPRGGKRIYKYVLYCVPTHSNPTGLTWDFETRRRVVEIAREWDVLVLCDDVYDFLSWGDDSGSNPPPAPLPRLVTLDRQLILAHQDGKGGNENKVDKDAGNVISNCSFSKLLGPGLRCGWQESATSILARQMADGGANHSGGCPSHFVSVIVGELLRPKRINEIISGVKKVLGERASLFIDACYKYLPPGSSIPGGGGYFLWVSLGPPQPHASPYDAREIVKLAAQGEFPRNGGEGELINKVTVFSGALSECPGVGNELGFGERWVRIAVSWCEAEEGVEGIRRLGGACRRWIAGVRHSIEV